MEYHVRILGWSASGKSTFFAVLPWACEHSHDNMLHVASGSSETRLYLEERLEFLKNRETRPTSKPRLIHLDLSYQDHSHTMILQEYAGEDIKNVEETKRMLAGVDAVLLFLAPDRKDKKAAGYVSEALISLRNIPSSVDIPVGVVLTKRDLISPEIDVQHPEWIRNYIASEFPQVHRALQPWLKAESQCAFFAISAFSNEVGGGSIYQPPPQEDWKPCHITRPLIWLLEKGDEVRLWKQVLESGKALETPVENNQLNLWVQQIEEYQVRYPEKRTHQLQELMLPLIVGLREHPEQPPERLCFRCLQAYLKCSLSKLETEKTQQALDEVATRKIYRHVRRISMVVLLGAVLSILSYQWYSHAQENKQFQKKQLSQHSSLCLVDEPGKLSLQTNLDRQEQCALLHKVAQQQGKKHYQLKAQLLLYQLRDLEKKKRLEAIKKLLTQLQHHRTTAIVREKQVQKDPKTLQAAVEALDQKEKVERGGVSWQVSLERWYHAIVQSWSLLKEAQKRFPKVSLDRYKNWTREHLQWHKAHKERWKQWFALWGREKKLARRRQQERKVACSTWKRRRDAAGSPEQHLRQIAKLEEQFGSSYPKLPCYRQLEAVQQKAITDRDRLIVQEAVKKAKQARQFHNEHVVLKELNRDYRRLSPLHSQSQRKKLRTVIRSLQQYKENRTYEGIIATYQQYWQDCFGNHLTDERLRNLSKDVMRYLRGDFPIPGARQNRMVRFYRWLSSLRQGPAQLQSYKLSLRLRIQNDSRLLGLTTPLIVKLQVLRAGYQKNYFFVTPSQPTPGLNKLGRKSISWGSGYMISIFLGTQNHKWEKVWSSQHDRMGMRCLSGPLQIYQYNMSFDFRIHLKLQGFTWTDSKGKQK